METILVLSIYGQGVAAGVFLGLHPANERRRYKVTPSLIGWAQTRNQPFAVPWSEAL